MRKSISDNNNNNNYQDKIVNPFIMDHHIKTSNGKDIKLKSFSDKLNECYSILSEIEYNIWSSTANIPLNKNPSNLFNNDNTITNVQIISRTNMLK